VTARIFPKLKFSSLRKYIIIIKKQFMTIIAQEARWDNSYLEPSAAVWVPAVLRDASSELPLGHILELKIGPDHTWQSADTAASFSLEPVTNALPDDSETVPVTPALATPAETAEGAHLWELVAQVQQGGDTGTLAFDQLYRATYPMVMSCLWSLTHNRTLSEDLASETYLRALKAMGNLQRGNSQVMAWLGTIARNLAADHFKSATYRRECPIDTVDTTEHAYDMGYVTSCGPRSPWHGTEEAALFNLEYAELRAVIREKVGQLATDEQAECVERRFLRGQTTEETARAMDKSRKAISVLQLRALKRLAKTLLKTHPELVQAFMA
jgi:RNA polymerase sigma factor (sigma-70 family)